MQPTYVGTNPMGNQTQSFSGSIHTSFDPYVSFLSLLRRLRRLYYPSVSLLVDPKHFQKKKKTNRHVTAAVFTRSRAAELIELDVHQFLSPCQSLFSSLILLMRLP
jgi:hypothetical protein